MKFHNLQVSNGLEILVSIESRLTFNMRCESADKYAEAHQVFRGNGHLAGFAIILVWSLNFMPVMAALVADLFWEA